MKARKTLSLIRRILLFILVLVVSLPLFPARADTSSCSWYEIFVRSYQDSDGDGIGDLKGVEKRLPQIADLGFDGLWLMPVMESPSYHKYDVTDYFAIDEEYGTMQDMRDLTEACHALGMEIIVDLPLNHTSSMHPWFLEAVKAVKAGDMENPYIGYYNISMEKGSKMVPIAGTDYAYEEQFSGGGMPDLNLDSETVWEEIRKILAFWLQDVGVDGFRLDAVTSFEAGNTEKNVELLARLKKEMESIKPGSFAVGEAWTGLSEIQKYYESGIDAFFLFPISQAEGWLCRALRARTPASKYAGYMEDLIQALPDKTWAPFLANHDTGRAIGSLQARQNPAVAKFAQLVLNMTGGLTFTYYGEEIGMVGSGDDPNKRLAMYWNDSDMTLQPPGVTKLEYAYPCFDDQAADPDSLLNYVKKINAIKKEEPLIAWGKTEIAYSDTHVLSLRKTLGDATCQIVMNFSGSSEKTFENTDKWNIDRTLCITGEVTESGGVLTLPPYGMAILKP